LEKKKTSAPGFIEKNRGNIEKNVLREKEQEEQEQK